MVRDVCQGGAGVALVVGKAGTGKTFALGIARHGWQLDGYRPLASAPTGIATVSLESEGFERWPPVLDHAQRAGAKVVLVGDDRQLAAIDAGGGFRALRLRLAPRSWPRTGGSSRPGNARPWSWSAPGWSMTRWPPTAPTTGSWPPTPSRPPPWPCWPTGGRPGRTLSVIRPQLPGR
jgi:hypothetical protein